jgi:hypothetical protein
MKKCKWCNKEIIEKEDNFENYCNRKCHRKFQYYSNREVNIQKTRDWVIKNKKRVAEYKHNLHKLKYIPKRIELNEELRCIVKRLREIDKRNKRRIWEKQPKVQNYRKEYRRRPEVKKYMRLKWKEWAKKNEIQIAIRQRIANNLRKKMNKLVEGKELMINHREDISLSKVALYLFERLPNDFYEKNYHIDHIKPLCSFDLTIKEQFLKAFAVENHRWLLAEDNLKKGAKDKLLSIKRRKNE